MKRFVVAGAVHLDIFADAKVPFREGIDVEGEFTLAIGGTAFNISTFLSSLGASTTLVSVLPKGSLFTRLILLKLKQLKIEHRILLGKDVGEPAFLALRENRDLRLAVTSSCVDSPPAQEYVEKEVACTRTDAFFLDANLHEETIVRAVERATAPVYLHAVSEIKGLRLLPLARRENLHRKVRFVFLNEQEWRKLSLATGEDDPRKVIRSGWVVTRGEKGATVYLPDGGRIQVPAPKLKKVESFSGLGDAFASGFAFGYEETKTVEGAIEVAHLLVRKKAKSPHASFVSVNIAEVEKELFVDKLTGVFTRSYFEEEKKYLLETSPPPYTVIMMDIDFFKKINDTYGHDRGDRVLRGVAQIIKDSIREEDVVVRYGGEEFMVVLKNGTPLESAGRIAERIRRRVQRARVDGLPVTISAGVAQGDDLEDTIKLADEALYESKREGRNKVTVLVPTTEGR